MTLPDDQSAHGTWGHPLRVDGVQTGTGVMWMSELRVGGAIVLDERPSMNERPFMVCGAHRAPQTLLTCGGIVAGHRVEKLRMATIDIHDRGGHLL